MIFYFTLCHMARLLITSSQCPLSARAATLYEQGYAKEQSQS